MMKKYEVVFPEVTFAFTFIFDSEIICLIYFEEGIVLVGKIFNVSDRVN